MEAKINIAEVLKDKPQGTKLYSSACGKCTLEEADDKSFKISFYNSKFGFMNGGEGYLDKNGKLYDEGECVVFPSREMRDWRKFAWKKGDVLVSKDNVHIIFEKFEDDAYTRFKGKHYLWKECDEEDYSKEETQMLTYVFKKANDDDAQTYINTIEEKLGGKLNRETLEIEKTQPEFKDGDILAAPSSFFEGDYVFIFKGYDNQNYLCYYVAVDNDSDKLYFSHSNAWCYNSNAVRYATDEDKQRLFEALAKEGKAWDAEKKAIVDLKTKVELKPFDKVLVRDRKTYHWEVDLFGFKTEGPNIVYHCVGGSWKFCIPYIGNESLLGTIKDVED